MATMTAVNMHDWTLHSVSVEWSRGALIIELSRPKGRCRLRAQEIKDINIARAFPWGPSVSINNIHGPTPCDNEMSCLTIEMQSGDHIQIVAKSFDLLNEVSDPT